MSCCLFPFPPCFSIVPTCGPPQLPPNSELWRSQSGKTSYNFNERVAIKCKSGYFMRGLGYRICDASGWTGPKSSCSRKLHAYSHVISAQYRKTNRTDRTPFRCFDVTWTWKPIY